MVKTMAASSQLSVDPDEYLRLEAEGTIKHEYINGEVYTMAEATDVQGAIAGNLFAMLRSHVRGTGC